MNSKFTNVDDYISSFPSEVQKKLELIRDTIKRELPENSVEVISYNIPTFKLNGNLVHYAAAKQHIGFYPAPSAIEHFQDKLTDFKTAKGSIQFPFNKKMPVDLIAEIVRFRIFENLNKRN